MLILIGNIFDILIWSKVVFHQSSIWFWVWHSSAQPSIICLVFCCSRYVAFIKLIHLNDIDILDDVTFLSTSLLAVFPERNHPPTHPLTRPYGFSCMNILPESLKWNVQCPPPRLLKHLRTLCGVPTLLRTSGQIPISWMCGVPP